MSRASAAVFCLYMLASAGACGWIVLNSWERGFLVRGGVAIYGSLAVFGVALACWMSYRRTGHVFGAKP